MRQNYRLEVNRSLNCNTFISAACASRDYALLFGQEGTITNVNFEDFFSTHLLRNLEIGVSCVDQFLPTTEQVENKATILVGCVDGSVKLLSPETYEVITSFSAHADCLSTIVWNKHGTSFLTSSMDGMVKLWSSKGAVRSTLMRLDAPVLDVSWGHDSSHIAFCSGSDLFIIDLRQQRTSKKWSPHSSAILRVEWSPVELVVLSGGDDCKFCLHNSTGERLFISEDLAWNISSLAWAPHGQSFCLAAGRTLFLYSSKAELLVQMELENECIQKVLWSLEPDRVIALSVCRLIMLDLKTSVHEQCVSEQYWDRLRNALYPSPNKNASAYSEVVVAISQEYDFLIAATEKQCVVLPKKTNEELHLIDLSSSPKVLLQTSKRFLILFVTGEVSLYNYNGLQMCSFQLPNKSGRYLTKDQISMSNAQVAVLDTSKRIVFCDAQTGDLQTSQDYGMRIRSVCLCQEGVHNGCLGVCLSEKRELFLFNSIDGVLQKLENFVSDVKWHSHEDSLAIIVIWYLVSHYSEARYLIDSLKQTIVRGVEEGTTIDEFQGSTCVLSSRKSGTRHLSLNPIPRFLTELTNSGKWKGALLLCRKLEDIMMWRFLGALAIVRNKEDVKTMCMSAIGEVEYLEHVMED